MLISAFCNLDRSVKDKPTPVACLYVMRQIRFGDVSVKFLRTEGLNVTNPKTGRMNSHSRFIVELQ